MTRKAPDRSTVNLTQCDREPIHILGSIQPFGFLIAVSADWSITRASENVMLWLGREPEDLLGTPLAEFIGLDATHAIRGRMQLLKDEDSVERLFSVSLLPDRPLFDLTLYRSGHSVVLEAEPASTEELNAANLVRNMTARVDAQVEIDAFCQEAVRQVRAVTGFDRVMLYKFDADGSGQVMNEAMRRGLDPFLGLRYPASDIPKQARALYVRNGLRLIADVHAVNVPIRPQLDVHGEPLDLSMSSLRSVSPIHIEYLQNMGVGASMSISVVRRGELWGLFACHHMSPRQISSERRNAAELFAQMFSWMLESREKDVMASYEARARSVHDRIMQGMAISSTGLHGITSHFEELREIIPSDGTALWVQGNATLDGDTPTVEEISGLIRFLNRAAPSTVYTSHHLSSVYPAAEDFVSRAAGVLAIPISRAPRDYLLFFRREAVSSATWAGNPEKPVSLGPNGVRLTPRKSFEAWREVVRGQSPRWSDAEIRVAELFRISLLEVILHLLDNASQYQRMAQERQELLIAELNHRVRNILALIRGLLSQSQANASDPVGFQKALSGRIHALARAHDQITAINWGPASLQGLIMTEASAYLATRADRLVTRGPAVDLDPQAFSAMALVIHEMMTNSAKYGALSDEAGRVEIVWELSDDLLVIDWSEHDGPKVTAPLRRGFGTTIIERTVPYELKGTAEIHYKVDGVSARFVLPGRFVYPSNASDVMSLPASDPLPPQVTRLARGGAALVVEDNLMIALDAEDALNALGFEHVELASSVSEALRSIAEAAPHFAILDYNLGLDTSVPIAETLAELKVPFVFATGYGDGVQLRGSIASTPVITKPYTKQQIQDSIARIIAASDQA